MTPSFCYFCYTGSTCNNVIYTYRDEFLVVKSMKLVLSLSNDNLFAFTEEYTFAVSSFIWWLSSLISLPVLNRLVSSAKSIGMKSLDIFDMSFIYRRKSKRPRMEPWGILHLSNLYPDSYSSKIADCLRLYRSSLICRLSLICATSYVHDYNNWFSVYVLFARQPMKILVANM